MSKIYPIILSGGIGSRLWPMSRRNYPKQFHGLTATEPMIVETAKRVSGDEFAAPTVICNNAHRFLVAAAFQEHNINLRALILEPEARNTAPAIAAAAMEVYKEKPDALILVLPSDHYISMTKQFIHEVKETSDIVSQGHLMSFSIKPDYPETGYGYIKHGEKIDDSKGVYKVYHFEEKPNEETAEKYLTSGNYSWNAGIFFAPASLIISEMEEHSLDIYEPVKAAVDEIREDLDFLRLGEGFLDAPNISFDYAVMERTKKALVCPINVGWSDIGSWKSLWDISDKDELGNVMRGQVCGLDVENCYLRSDDQNMLLAAIGVEDITAVVADNVVMIARKDDAQRVKDLITAIDHNGQKKFIESSTSRQPWGYSRTLKTGKNFTAKEVMMKPGYHTATQIHKKKSEHWVVLQGEAYCQIGDETMTLKKGESTYIPIDTPHTLWNKSEEPIVIFEVQSGDIDDTDVIRLSEATKNAPIKAV